jgi:DNA-binding NarL/FixJ family response regulator
LIIADDHEMVREGFRRIIESHADMKIVATVPDGATLQTVLEETEADVLLLDISMPGPGFPRLMESIRKKYPQLAVLVVSMHQEDHWAVQALKVGAAGYLTKSHSAEELAAGVRRVHAGGRYITPSVAESLAARLGPSGSEPSHASLSRREFEVLQKLGAGKMVKTVAREMDLSPKTVSTYRMRILEKLSLDSTADLIRYAVEHNLLS